MRQAIALAVSGTLWLAGCAVTDEKYPAGWDPLPPPMSASCARYAGSYADRGEPNASGSQPSLTYALFGHHSGWQKAERVDFALPREGALEITVWEAQKPLLSRTLTTKADEFTCKDGRMVVRSRRWVAAELVSGRENITIEFSDDGPRLVAHVLESTYGAIFAVVPIAGTAGRWHRFARLSP